MAFLPSLASLAPLFQSGEGNVPVLAGCHSPGKMGELEYELDK